MGGFCGCGTSLPALKDPKLIRNNLKRALQMVNLKLNEFESQQIDNFLKIGSNQILELKSVQLIQNTILEKDEINPLTRLVENRTESLIVLLSPMKIDKLPKKTEISGEGIVVYSVGFYLGNLYDKYANGKGSFYFCEPEAQHMNLKVEGNWQNGQLLNGKFFSGDGDLLLMIEFKDEKQKSKVEYFEKGRKHSLFKYIGTIKDVKKHSITKLEEIMTGVGQIEFQNGDIYKGAIKNGLMHSSELVKSIYKQKLTQIVYEGKFVQGKRHGKAEIIIPIYYSFLESNDSFVEYKLTVEYNQGNLIKKEEKLTKLKSNQSWIVDVMEKEGEIEFKIKGILS